MKLVGTGTNSTNIRHSIFEYTKLETELDKATIKNAILEEKLAENNKLKKVDTQTLIDAGLVSKNDKVKILGNGELKIKLDVKAHAFSKTAIQAIESLQGTVEKI